jgi:predicted nuclease with RNAse H fold
VPDEWAGVDLGALRIDVVVVGGDEGARRVSRQEVFPAEEIDAVADLVAGARAVAIDAPAELSTAPHRDDPGVNRKFRVARCGEIALGEQARIWVPWVTPSDPALVPPWMRVGFSLWRALRERGCEPLEVYPAGVFRVLAGTRLAAKTSAAGRAARIQVLARSVEVAPSVASWSHDGIDALAAALTAHHVDTGTATRHAHSAPGCDDSAIWLPPGPR